SYEEGICKEQAAVYLKNLVITEDYRCLADCGLVIECTLENESIKRSVYEKVERYISDEAILASNTSAIPISDLQKLTRIPRRFLGLHWAEPSHTTRFLEIICGAGSDVSKGEYLYEL